MRSRLVALILVPTLAASFFGGLRVATSISTAADYQRVNDLARLVDSVARLTHELQAERDRAAWNAAIGRPDTVTSTVVAQIGLVDKAATAVRDLATGLRSRIGNRAGEEIEHILGKLDSLEPLRKQAVRGDLLPSAVLEQYSLVIEDLLALQDELAKGTQDDRLASMSVTLAALAKSKEAASVQRGMLTTVLPVGRFEQDQLQDFLGAVSAQERELRTFRKNATREERGDYDTTVTGRRVDQAEFLRTLVLDRANSGFSLNTPHLDLTTGDDTREWFDAMSQSIDRMRSVEAKLTSAIVARSQTLKDAEQRRAVIVAVAVAVLLIAVLLITSRVAGSLVRPLRRLRSEALEVAGHRLPDTVQRLREAGDGTETPPIVPIGVVARDEIGEVARAFDEVHREAVRLAGDEARLRSNINAMFVNLSRRTQTLVERQLALIDGLEQGEQDEQRLSDLFRLDHLATRMRRNSENLLVLAGQEPARRWGRPVPVVDVVRASLSEVESYERVSLQVQPGAAIVGQAVNDVVHLVAELVENSVSFSPHETKVTVSSSRIDGGGLIISVSDHGIGMTPEELAQVNHRLANPPVVDVSVSRRMGLFVVGRLALRHGIRVQMRPQENGGLTAMVLLPEALLAPAGPAFPGVPGVPQPEQAPPMFGAGSQLGAPAFGAPALTGPVPSENGSRPPAFRGNGHGGNAHGADADPFHGMPRSPVLGADAPGVGSPGQGPFKQHGPLEQGSSERGPFETFPGQALGFDSGLLARDTPTGFETGAFDAGAFDTGAFDGDPFERGAIGMAPVDTPWPGELPPPGSTTWPGLARDDGGWPGTPGRGPFDGDDDIPLPVVHTSPLEPEGEFLPIFAAVESDWFKKADIPAEPEDCDGETTGSWASPADAGWQAAEAASEPTLGGVTSSGLPKRVPKANLVPGSATAESAEQAAPAPAVPRHALSPERVRSRLSSLQQGVRQGRAVARGESSDDHGYPGAPSLGDPTARGTDKENP